MGLFPDKSVEMLLLPKAMNWFLALPSSGSEYTPFLLLHGFAALLLYYLIFIVGFVCYLNLDINWFPLKILNYILTTCKLHKLRQST